MLVGMVPLPVPPVKAPSSNLCSSHLKLFASRTFEKSLKSSAPAKANSTHFDPLRFTNSFTLILFADPHPLNSVVSYRYKNSGGRRDSTDRTATHSDFIYRPANSCALNLFADPLKPLRVNLL